MINVVWNYLYTEAVYGNQAHTTERAEVPRVPRLGEFVEEYEVVKIVWSERMDLATVYLREPKL